jgi:L-amino acid N-acyltransferase YncA
MPSTELQAGRPARERNRWLDRTDAGFAQASLRGSRRIQHYVAERAHRRGIGSALLQALIDAAELNDIWTLQSGIFPENTASLELCRRFGFRTVGTRERIGCMDGRWRDVVLVERRSSLAGV